MSAKSARGPSVRSRWFDTSTVGGLLFGESLTKQEFKEECDINIVLARYQDSPPRPFTNPARLRYGEFASAPDFLNAQLLVKEAEETFSDLPVALRDRFNHSPARFLEFVHDPKNKDEARKLGLLKPEPPAPTPPTDTKGQP